MEENQNQNQWYDAEGIDQSFVSDKVKTFTNSDGSMNVNELPKATTPHSDTSAPP